jgi:hypothetical protein
MLVGSTLVEPHAAATKRRRLAVGSPRFWTANLASSFAAQRSSGEGTASPGFAPATSRTIWPRRVGSS